MKVGDLVKYNLYADESNYVYGVGILLMFSTTGEFAHVLWTNKGTLWSTVKFLEVVREV